MKIGLLIFVFVISLSLVSAAECSLNAKMVYQDPHPAMPNEYVDVVFQITGVDNPECKNVRFDLLEKYPFSLDPEKSSESDINGGVYFNGEYSQYWNIPYKIRIDKDALQGENQIAVQYYSNSPGKLLIFEKEFNITIDDVRTDFEVSIKDFNAKTNIITFEILNIGEHDAEALTIEIPKQENIEIKGGNRNIVGDLDANEDTTFTFEAIPKDGDIELKILYNDEINVRRELIKNEEYDSSLFTNRKEDEAQKRSNWFYVSIALIVIIIFTWVHGWWKKKQKKKKFEKEKK